jgi:galactokinase
MDLAKHVVSVFKEKFKKAPAVFIAPGRINLIGEHTDYNEGLVMPTAIDKHMVFAIAPSGNDRCNIYASDFGEGVTFSIHDLNPGQTWVNYLMGMVDGFQRSGLPVRGVDCVFGGNIPSGAGLSSSAALCCGFGFALNEIFGLGLSRLDLVKTAQGSEHRFVGAMVGIMDQYASLFGEENSVMLLDCRSMTHQYLPFHFPEIEILLVDSKVKHAIASTAYNDRRAACEEGLWIIQKQQPDVQSLRDVSRVLLYQNQDKLREDVFIKCLFVIEEIARTRQAATLLQASDLKGFGELMYQTHWGLSQAYEVSCEELDMLVTLAEEERNDVIGSRMMGGGFGGCTINLVRRGQEEIFKEKVRQKYFTTFKKEPDFYPVKLSKGVHAISLPKTNP